MPLGTSVHLYKVRSSIARLSNRGASVQSTRARFVVRFSFFLIYTTNTSFGCIQISFYHFSLSLFPPPFEGGGWRGVSQNYVFKHIKIFAIFILSFYFCRRYGIRNNTYINSVFPLSFRPLGLGDYTLA